MILLGGGDNGKTVLIGTVIRLLGHQLGMPTVSTTSTSIGSPSAACSVNICSSTTMFGLELGCRTAF